MFEHQGLWFGLNIAKELVALNLGRIDVESEIGVGSTFSFTLPIFLPRRITWNDTSNGSIRCLGDETPDLAICLSVDLTVRARTPCPVVDEFLQRSVRSNDLVVSYRPRDRWVIAAACPACDCERLIGRLAKEWADFLRNSPKLELPQLAIEHHQSYAIGRDREELVEAYVALADSHDELSPSRQTVLVVDDDAGSQPLLVIAIAGGGLSRDFCSRRRGGVLRSAGPPTRRRGARRANAEEGWHDRAPRAAQPLRRRCKCQSSCSRRRFAINTRRSRRAPVILSASPTKRTKFSRRSNLRCIRRLSHDIRKPFC